MKKQIGWYIVKKSATYTNLYECAAWYEDILVEPDRYELFADIYRVGDNGEIDCRANSAYASIPGTVIRDNFGARYFGMPIGEYDCKKNVGKPSAHTVMPYLFSIAESVLTNADTPYELLPEYEARKFSFISLIDGRTITTHGIFAKEGAQ